MNRKVTSIEISGKSLPIRVTMGAMLRFKQTTGKDVGRMEREEIGDLMTFLYCCLSSACHADGVEMTVECGGTWRDLDFDLFCDMVDVETMAVLGKLLMGADTEGTPADAGEDEKKS